MREDGSGEPWTRSLSPDSAFEPQRAQSTQRNALYSGYNQVDLHERPGTFLVPFSFRIAEIWPAFASFAILAVKNLG